MQKIFKFIPPILLLVIVVFIFKSWFLPGLITAGDLWPYSKLMYSSRPIIPYAWELNTADGLGGFVSPLLWIYINFGTSITILGSWLGLSWSVIERAWYFYPFLVLSTYSSYKLFSKLFSKSNFSVLAAAIFTLNTYILMVIGGGQIPGIGIAYSLIPLILYIFIEILESLDKNKTVFYKSILVGILLSIQSVFDIRVSYITLSAVFILWVFQFFRNKTIFIKSVIFIFVIPAIIVFLLNAFWIIPTVLSGKNPVVAMGSAYSSSAAVKFFSFAKFEDTISLLHPNWPENIFGKVGFLKPEFLFLPILVFLSLLFLKKETIYKRKFVIFFASLGLLGAFLAKGANDPLGGIYLWLFNHFPGFIMFRDPTKWYILVALSYSMLIPYSVEKLYEFLKSKTSLNKLIPQGLIIVVILYLLFLIRPGILGQLNGTFKPVSVPSDYVKLEAYLSNQNNFFRTLWLPSTQRFAYYSNNHPAVPAQIYFNKQDINSVIEALESQDTKKQLQESSVKYLIVPYDSQGEIFLKDRVYNEKLYLQTVKNVSSIQWLKRINGFGKIAVFEVPNPKDHFWTTSKSLSINFNYVSPIEYILKLKNAKAGDVVIFSESFDKKWIARSPNNNLFDLTNALSSKPFDKIFNSFILTKPGVNTLDIYYYPQIFVNIGSIISILSLVVIIGYLFWVKKINK